MFFVLLAREFDGSERWRSRVGFFGWDSYDLAGPVGGSCARGSGLLFTFWVLCLSCGDVSHHLIFLEVST